MKLSSLLLIALISTFISATACKDTKGDASTETPVSTVQEGGTVEPAATLSTGSTSATGSTEKHYKCTTAGCTGSGDAQGKCPVCGAELVHNQAFHSQGASTPGSSPANPVQVNPTNSTAPATPATAATPPSAKNAKGVYHYSCPKGHEGGSASAANCPKCGEPMVHNQAFHD